MPKITNNNGDLSKAFFGTAEVDKIFLGSTELYSKAPAGYVILAGAYYGKSSPAIPSGSEEILIDLPFITGSQQNAYSIRIYWENPQNYRRFITYGSGFPQYDIVYAAYSYYSGVWNTNSDFRNIIVTQDTTVTQEQYEAFFGCFEPIPSN